jgi:CheY-like chemotaxis protein
MSGKRSWILALLLLPQMHSIKRPKDHLIEDDHHHLFLSSYNNKVDPSIRIKKYELTTRRNSNDDVLTNTNSNSQSRIMVVDDEQDIARLFATSLERNGFAVDVFNDPLSALSNYKPGLYDLSILDIMMPDMNGFELYQKIKDIDDKANVCFITAYDESLHDYKKLFPSLEDVNCFLKKPIEMHNLVKIVKSKIDYN